MIVDNFKEIKELLKFETQYDFYFVQIIQRKKDGENTIESSNNGYRVIKSYYIKSLEEWDRREEKVKELCDRNHARCYITINRKNTKECCWEAANKYLELLRNDHTHQGYKIWDHACGVSKSIDKMWMVDVDTKDSEYLYHVIYNINSCEGKHDGHIIKIIPSHSGFHLITEGFNLKKFNQLCMIDQMEIPDVHKQGIVLLYFNDLSSQSE